MKWLTYQRQIALGVIVVILGHILSDVTGVGFFVNLGWIGYGLLWLVHPVWSQRANEHPRIRIYVQVAGAVILLLGCMLRSGAGDDFLQNRISESLGIDASRGTVVESYDDHSGFHVDGTLFAVLSFPDDALQSQIAAPGGWYALPMTEELHTLLYGTRTEEAAIGPYVGVTIPKVEEGYWILIDRHSEREKSEILDGGSFNYTAAVYDALHDCLIYVEYDT